MTAILRTVSTVVAFGDASPTQNPKMRYVDWARDITEELVDNPRSESYQISPGQEKLIFDGTRSIALDNTTVIDFALVTGTADRYRFTWSGGTDPAFRTARTFSIAGASVTVAAQANSTAVLTVTGGSFTGITVGDTLWINSTSAFNPVNQGFWTVLAVSATSMTVARADGTNNMYSEGPIVVVSAADFKAFSADGVQVGDKLEVSAGFSTSILRSYSIVAVTSTYLEVSSTATLPNQSSILPGIGGMLVFTALKRWLRIEADQECVIRVNGDTSSFQRLSPWASGDQTKIGEYVKTGPVWSLKILNKSVFPANAIIISVE